MYGGKENCKENLSLESLKISDGEPEIAVQVNAPLEWVGNITEEDLTVQVLDALVHYNDDNWITVAGVRAKLTFACNGDIFFIPEDNPEDVEILNVSVPQEWKNGIPVTDLEAMVVEMVEKIENSASDDRVTINDVEAKYFKCDHGYAWFIPTSMSDKTERIRVWCTNHS